MPRDDIFPFYLPAGPAGQGSVVYVPPVDSDANGELELKVIVGGPVFLFEGRLDVTEAYNRSHSPGNVDFDLAAAAGGSASRKSIQQGSEGILTLQSDAETIGYVRWEYAH